MRRKFLLIGFVILTFQLCVTPLVFAKLYTWVDRNGVTRRTYYPPPADQVKTSQKNTINQVELFVTSWCPYCKKAKNYFRSKGIEIKIYDIEKDIHAAMRKNSLDNSGGVPFAIVNGINISGYAPERYSKALR